jgi:hypothetical protein
VQLAGSVLIAIHWGDPGALAFSAVTFAVTSGVAVVFVGAYSIACTTLLWPVLYQFLFVGYWFWGNFLNPHTGIPTLNGTLLTPDGRYILGGFFPIWPRFQQSATPLQAAESLALLLGCALVALVAAWGWLRWRRWHA